MPPRDFAFWAKSLRFRLLGEIPAGAITNPKRYRKEYSTDSSHYKGRKCTENNTEMLGTYGAIYMGKPEIPHGKSNGTRKSVWEA